MTIVQRARGGVDAGTSDSCNFVAEVDPEPTHRYFHITRNFDWTNKRLNHWMETNGCLGCLTRQLLALGKERVWFGSEYCLMFKDVQKSKAQWPWKVRPLTWSTCLAWSPLVSAEKSRAKIVPPVECNELHRNEWRYQQSARVWRNVPSS